jgi:hypothetical protein
MSEPIYLSDCYVICCFRTPFVRECQAVIVHRPSWDGDYWRKWFPRADWGRIYTFRIEGRTPGQHGLIFTSDLSGPGGAYFTLLLEPGQTRENLSEAKAYLKRQRDVTGFTVYHAVEPVERPGGVQECL